MSLTNIYSESKNSWLPCVCPWHIFTQISKRVDYPMYVPGPWHMFAQISKTVDYPVYVPDTCLLRFQKELITQCMSLTHVCSDFKNSWLPCVCTWHTSTQNLKRVDYPVHVPDIFNQNSKRVDYPVCVPDRRWCVVEMLSHLKR